MKLLVDEHESATLAARLDHEGPDLVASLLVETELRRLAHRVEGLDQSAISIVLAGVSLYELPASLFLEAGLLPGSALRSLDALHLASAIRLEVDALLTYDLRMTEAAQAMGMPVVAPSATPPGG